MIQLAKSGVVCFGSTAEIETMRMQFDQQRCIRLRKFLEPRLLDLIRSQINQAEFYEREHKGVGVELCLRDNLTTGLLHLLVNNDSLFGLMQEITGCEHIGSFEGRVYRVIPASGHYDSWHSDIVDHRMVGMSVNLSTDAYSGGILQIRARQSKQILHETANIGFGDAIVFRLSPNLEHRISDVEGNAPKTVFAGWFKSQPEFLSLFKERFDPLPRA